MSLSESLIWALNGYTRVLWKYKDDSYGEYDNWGSAKLTYEKGVFNYGEYEGDD